MDNIFFILINYMITADFILQIILLCKRVSANFCMNRTVYDDAVFYIYTYLATHVRVHIGCLWFVDASERKKTTSTIRWFVIITVGLRQCLIYHKQLFTKYTLSFTVCRS